MSVKQVHEYVSCMQLDAQMEDYVKLWRVQMQDRFADLELVRSKIKCNHLILTRISKTAFSFFMRQNGSLVTKKKGEFLHLDKPIFTKCFYVVLYGQLTMLDSNNQSFGETLTHGFTIGEEALFESTLTDRYEKVKAL